MSADYIFRLVDTLSLYFVHSSRRQPSFASISDDTDDEEQCGSLGCRETDIDCLSENLGVNRLLCIFLSSPSREGRRFWLPNFSFFHSSFPIKILDDHSNHPTTTSGSHISPSASQTSKNRPRSKHPREEGHTELPDPQRRLEDPSKHLPHPVPGIHQQTDPYSPFQDSASYLPVSYGGHTSSAGSSGTTFAESPFASFYSGTMQAYPSVGSGHSHNAPYSHLPSASAGFYNAQNNPAYSAMLPQAYGRNLKSTGQNSSGGLTSATAGYMGPAFAGSFGAVQPGQNPYAAYAGAAYNAAAFSASPSCSSPTFPQQQALDYTYGNYGQNPAYAAYYSAHAHAHAHPGYPPAYMSAAAAAAASSNNNALSTHSITAATAAYQMAHQLAPPSADSHYSSNSTTATTTPSPPLKENGSTPNSTKKGRSSKSRGRRQNNPTPPPEGDHMDRVFIWNLEDTIIIFAMILAQDHLPDLAQHTQYKIGDAFVREMAHRMDELIVRVSEEYLFGEDLYECDQVHIDDVASDDNGQDLSTYNFAADGFRAVSPSGNLCMASGVRGGVDWMRKLAFRYRRIKEVYNSCRSNPGALCRMKDDWMTIRTQLEAHTGDWSKVALKCLSMIAERDTCTNVLVTGNSLVSAVGKLLLFGLAEAFPIENVYSSAKVGKETCYERILNRYGRKCTYVVVGNGPLEENAAKQMNFPFWRVESMNHLVALHHALDVGHL